MATTGVKVGSVDIQFGKDFDQYKANQLVQELQKVISAVNNLALQTGNNTTAIATPTPQVLATQVGLGPYLTVSGLIAGQVLIAQGPTTAHFGTYQVSFGNIAGTDAATFTNPNEGEVIAFHNGYWSAVPALTPLGLQAPNSDVVLMWDPTKNAGAGGLSWAAAGTGIVIAPGSISAPTSALSGTDTPLTWLDM